jgi:hypothetical protein
MLSNDPWNDEVALHSSTKHDLPGVAIAALLEACSIHAMFCGCMGVMRV